MNRTHQDCNLWRFTELRSSVLRVEGVESWMDGDKMNSNDFIDSPVFRVGYRAADGSMYLSWRWVHGVQSSPSSFIHYFAHTKTEIQLDCIEVVFTATPDENEFIDFSLERQPFRFFQLWLYLMFRCNSYFPWHAPYTVQRAPLEWNGGAQNQRQIAWESMSRAYDKIQ